MIFYLLGQEWFSIGQSKADMRYYYYYLRWISDSSLFRRHYFTSHIRIQDVIDFCVIIIPKCCINVHVVCIFLAIHWVYFWYSTHFLVDWWYVYVWLLVTYKALVHICIHNGMLVSCQIMKTTFCTVFHKMLTSCKMKKKNDIELNGAVLMY